MTAAEQQLIEVCQEIGSITYCTCHYTAGLAQVIEATDKSIQDLTVCELLHMTRQHNVTFNRIHGN